MKYTPYILPQLASVALFVGLLIPARRYRHLPAVYPFYVGLILALLKAIFSLLNIAAVNLSLKIIWSQLGFVAGSALPVTYLALILAYTGRAHWLTQRRLTLLLAIPVGAQILALTGGWHSLFRYDYHLQWIGSLPVLHWTNGIMLWIYEIYTWALIFCTCALLLAALREHTTPRRDTWALIIAAVITGATHTLSASTSPLLLSISAETMAHVLGGGIGIWVLLRHQVLGIAPVAMSTVVTTIADPVIVLDARRRITFANPAAQVTCGLPRHFANATTQDLAPTWAQLFQRYPTTASIREEVTVGEGAEQRVYDLTISPLTHNNRRDHLPNVGARLFLLHDITGRKQVETSLRQLSQAVAQTPTPIVITDSAGTIRFVNPAFEHVTGYNMAEALGQNPRILKSGRHPPHFYEELWATLCAGQPWHGEFYNRKKDGTTYWENAAISPVLDGTGTITHFVAVKEDITARKMAEAQLRESETRYRMLAENVMDVIWILDLDAYRFRYVSASVERLRGYSVEEVLNQELSEALTPASLADFRQAIPARVARFRHDQTGIYTDEVEQTCKDGTTVWTEVSSRFLINPETGHVEIFGVSRDIRDRKRAEDEIARTHARLKSLVNILQYPTPSVQAFLDYALDEAITLTRSKIGYIYHYSETRQEFTLNTWSKGVMDVCAIREPQTVYQLASTGIWGEAVRQRRPILVNDFDAPHPLKRGYPDGHAPLHTFMTVPVFQQDQIVAVIGLANKETAYDQTDVLQITLLLDTVWNVLDHRRDQEALQRYAEELEAQNRELDAFAHTVAHDLRNSLGGILGAVELLRDDETTTHEDTAFALDAITWSVNKLQTIVDELMTLSGVRKQTVTSVPLDMHGILTDVQQRLRDAIKQANATITVLHADSWPVALGHAPWVEEVWTNYLSNAIKYGGTPPHLTVGAAAQDDGAIRFWVRDNGPGVAPEDLNRLFIPFERLDQVRAQGHGLGLSIVQRIIDKLGGQVGVETHNGDGSTFYFTLPLAPD